MQTNRRRVRGKSHVAKLNSAVIETLEKRTLMTVFTVTSTGDGGVPGDGSLRSAINASNADTAQNNSINFNIGAGVQTIGVGSNLPKITHPVNIDATTEPDYAGTPLVVLDGVLIVAQGTISVPTGLSFAAGANGSSVRGLEIVRFGYAGIYVFSADNVRIAGNYIGTDGTSSSTSLGNGNSEPGFVDPGGIVLTGAGAIIGGTDASDRNVISGNRDGISLFGAHDALVEGNYIGTNAAGTAAVANVQGIYVVDEYPAVGHNQIGGNLISGNTTGIYIESSNGTHVWGNLIGTDATATAPLGNTGEGVFVSEDSADILIGGSASAAGNIIAYNGNAGVEVNPKAVAFDDLVTIRLNSIFSNGGLGIDLNGDGITANDASDSDGGPNDQQNFPVLVSATADSGNLKLVGVINSNPNTTLLLDFYSNTALDLTGSGEGQSYVGTTIVTTDASGNASYAVSFPSAVVAGQFISATATTTATAPYGDTSEFSPDVQVAGPPPGPAPTLSINDVSQAEGNSGTTNFTFTVTRSGNVAGASDVYYATADGTAIAPGDYTAVPSTLVHFAANETSKQITVLVKGDTSLESDETFLVNLSSPTGATIADGQGVGTIANDDVAASAVIVSDPTDNSKFMLLVSGTTGNDVIRVNSTGKGSTVDLVINSQFVGRYSPVNELVVWGLAGDDDIAVDPKLNYPSILVGDEGADTLQGGTGRNILIGGVGADHLHGSGTDDILIAGSTHYDHNLQALAMIQKEWIKGGDLKARINHLTNGGGLNGAYLLNGSTVTSDSDADVLTGGGGHDWFIFGTADKITDLTKDDAATLI